MQFIEVQEGRTKASLVRLGRCIALQRGMWGEVFDLDALDGRINLYRHLCHRKDGKYLRHYIDTLRALEWIKQQIDEQEKAA